MRGEAEGIREGRAEEEEKMEEGGMTRRGTELATETVIWRSSQNGDVLCHSARR